VLIRFRRHGVFRPGLSNKVASNSDETIAAALKEGFTYYSEKPSDIDGVLEKLSRPLKGVGPATASLLLAVHDSSNIVFFSDELYRWLLHDGKKVSPKYTVKEVKDLFSKAKSFMSRIKCSPIELEKAAFVIIKENEPVPEPKAKKVPSGLPRGRPKKPDSEKQVKVPSGRGRGRPPKVLTAEEIAERAEKAARAASGEVKKRGRKPKAKDEDVGGNDDVKAEAAEETTATPASKKRKVSEAPTSSGKQSGKRAKT
jgi:hypothetical protein